MARPSKYTPEREALVVEALEAGTSRKGAAEYAGVNEGTLIAWMKRFPGFSSAVMRAEAAVEIRASRSLQVAFDSGDWRAGLAWLERRRHQQWGKVDRVEIEIRRTAERIAEQYPAESRPDPEWLIKRAQEIVQKAATEGVSG